MWLTGCSGTVAPRHIVLVSIDTLHVDWTSPYNAEVRSTPFLDELAREGVTFRWAYTSVPVTLPSHASLMTGSSPSRVGVMTNGSVVPEEARTLAEAYREAGYRTAAFISLGVLGRGSGLDQGFDHYHAPFEGSTARWYRRADEVWDPAARWMEASAGEPFFLWLHLSDPHAPYQSLKADFDTRLSLNGETLEDLHLEEKTHRLELTLAPGEHVLEWISLRNPSAEDRPETDLYLRIHDMEALSSVLDASWASGEHGIRLRPNFRLPLVNREDDPVELEIAFSGELVRPTPADVLPEYEREVAYVDEHLRELDTALETLGIKAETLLVVVSDHGEGLFRKDVLGHAEFVNEDQLRILWMMRGRGIPPGVSVGAPVGIQDVAPTLVQLTGVEMETEGRSRVSCWQGGVCPGEPWWAFGVDHDRSVISSVAGYRWPYKWVWRRGQQKRGGYEIERDAWEANDLLEAGGPHNPEELKALAESFSAERRRLTRALRESAVSGNDELLRTLGYVGRARQ